MCSPRFFYQIEPDLGLLRGELEQIFFMAACERLDASRPFPENQGNRPGISDGCEMPDGGHPGPGSGKSPVLA